jgi:hypothetical protein
MKAEFIKSVAAVKKIRPTETDASSRFDSAGLDECRHQLNLTIGFQAFFEARLINRERSIFNALVMRSNVSRVGFRARLSM